MEGEQSVGSYYHDASVSAVFEDLASRFLVNLPAEEQKETERICFQVESAYWFYNDFVRPQNSLLPSFGVRHFFATLLRSSGLRLDGDLDTAYDRFLKYKVTVPVCGAIMLNPTMDNVVLVKGIKANSTWTFPRGKINRHELDRDCAVREVWEETGYDLSPHFDPTLRPHPVTSRTAPPTLPHEIELDDLIEIKTRESRLRLFIVPDVSEHTPFETRTRGEIGKIEWFPIAKLPASHQTHARAATGSGAEETATHKFFMVAPVVGYAAAEQHNVATKSLTASYSQLKAWIKRRKKAHTKRQRRHVSRSPSVSPNPAEPIPLPSQVAIEQPQRFTDVAEAERALRALFFGPDHAANGRSAEVNAAVSRVAELATPALLASSSTQTGEANGLLNEEERERKQAALLDTLFAISDTAPPSSASTSTSLLDSIFASASTATSGTTSLPSSVANASPARLAAADALLQTLRGAAPPPQPTFSHSLPASSSYPHQAQQLPFDPVPPPQHSPYTSLPPPLPYLPPPHIAPGYAMPPLPLQPQQPPSFSHPLRASYGPPLPPAPASFAGLPPYPPAPHQPQSNGYPYHGHQPHSTFPPPSAYHHDPGYYSPPSVPQQQIVVSSAGPPLQPMPRRPIGILDVPTPPPAQAPPQADALLSLLNAGGGGLGRGKSML